MLEKTNKDFLDETGSFDLEADFETAVTQEQLRDLGIHELVYVQEVTLKRAKQLFPELDEFPELDVLFAVYAANGSPILLAENLESAFMAADDHELEIAMVH